MSKLVKIWSIVAFFFVCTIIWMGYNEGRWLRELCASQASTALWIQEKPFCVDKDNHLTLQVMK
jgi:hypothetical protein